MIGNPIPTRNIRFACELWRRIAARMPLMLAKRRVMPIEPQTLEDLTLYTDPLAAPDAALFAAYLHTALMTPDDQGNYPPISSALSTGWVMSPEIAAAVKRAGLTTTIPRTLSMYVRPHCVFIALPDDRSLYFYPDPPGSDHNTAYETWFVGKKFIPALDKAHEQYEEHPELFDVTDFTPVPSDAIEAHVSLLIKEKRRLAALRVVEVVVPNPKPKRGRPPGSKNKPRVSLAERNKDDAP